MIHVLFSRYGVFQRPPIDTFVLIIWGGQMTL